MLAFDIASEAGDSREALRATGRFETSTAGYRELLADGECVLDAPAKLAARARVFDTGQGRKTDAADAMPSSWWRCGIPDCVS